MKLINLLFLASAVLSLTGCVGTFTSDADLSRAAPPVRVLENFSYASKENPAPSEILHLEYQQDGTYVGTSTGDGANPVGEAAVVSFFGPIAGYYVVQVAQGAQGAKAGAKPFQHYVVDVNPDGKIQVANGSINEAVGRLLLERADADMQPENGSVSELTDHPFVNWAILRKAILDNADSLAFELTLIPQD